MWLDSDILQSIDRWIEISSLRYEYNHYVTLKRKFCFYFCSWEEESRITVSVSDLSADILIFSIIWKMETLISCCSHLFKCLQSYVASFLKILFGICSQH